MLLVPSVEGPDDNGVTEIMGRLATLGMYVLVLGMFMVLCMASDELGLRVVCMLVLGWRGIPRFSS